MDGKSNSRRIVAIVPVKSKSERVASKNFKTFSDGKSLLDILLQKLLKLKLLDHIYISTNKKDLEISHEKITILERDEKYCNNVTPWSDVIYEIASKIPEPSNTTVMWSQVTSPLFSDYEKALDTYLNLPNEYNSLVTVEQFKEFLIDENGRGINYNHGAWFTYSQYLPTLYKVLHNLFILQLSEILKLRYVINNKPYLFQVDSMSATDIDWNWQWNLAKILYEEKLDNKK